MKKINEKITISQILELPHGEEILRKYKVPCLSCPMAAEEINFLTIGDVAKMYDLPKKEIIKELNNER